MGQSAKARAASARRAEIKRQQEENYIKWWCNERLKDALWYNYLDQPDRAYSCLATVAREVTITHEEERQQAAKEAQTDATATG